jgi:transposase
MLHLSAAVQYYLYTGITDMRKGFDSLYGVVSSQMKLDAMNGSIFIFINRKCNQIKIFLWEGDGLSVYHKRLEKGTYELPSQSSESSSIILTWQQLQFILQGVALQKIQYRKRYKKVA